MNNQKVSMIVRNCYDNLEFVKHTQHDYDPSWLDINGENLIYMQLLLLSQHTLICAPSPLWC